jgi:hypothetical protein
VQVYTYFSYLYEIHIVQLRAELKPYMKRSVWVLIFVQLITRLVVAQPQDKDSTTPVDKLDCKILSFTGTESKHADLLPFSRIVVEDVRQDTSKLGFSRWTQTRRSGTYCASGSFQVEIAGYLNKYFQKNLDSQSPYELLVCIKKLWLSQFDTTNGKLPVARTFPEFLYYKADVYLRQGENYYPVLRVDTIFSGNRREASSSALTIQNAFLHTISSVRHSDISIVIKRKTRNREEINAYNKQPALPIFQVPVPEKGIYCSFQEFKYNQPCHKEFLIRFEAAVDIIYVKGADGNLFVKRDIWGLSDGKNVFIRMGDNLFPMYNRQNTWEFFGTFKFIKTNFEIPAMFGPGIPLSLAVAAATTQGMDEARFKAVDMRPYQVDMETGKFY